MDGKTRDVEKERGWQRTIRAAARSVKGVKSPSVQNDGGDGMK